MSAVADVLRYTAFSTHADGGNPAGVVLDARGLSPHDMQRIAADVGYSESAFLSPRADGAFDMRYFSPKAEVSFCGHATIAASIAYAERHGAGEIVLHTGVGPVRVRVQADVAAVSSPAPGDPAQGNAAALVATLTSVEPRVAALDDVDLDRLLSTLHWRREDLDPALPPAIGYAGAWHPVIAVKTRQRLAQLDYDFDALAELMAARGWLTVNLVWREDATTFHARNPFPPGGVVEDPATGAAAAALGAYLAMRNALPPARAFTIHQGSELGRPSVLRVQVPATAGAGVEVSGSAVPIRAASSPRRPA